MDENQTIPKSPADQESAVQPEVTGAALERARAAEADAHDRTSQALTSHLVALVRSSFPGADGITVAFPRLESDGRWDAVLAAVWAGLDEFADDDGPPCEEVLYDHETAQRPHRLAVGCDWQSAVTEVERLLTELAARGALYDWNYVDNSGSRRYMTLAELRRE